MTQERDNELIGKVITAIKKAEREDVLKLLPKVKKTDLNHIHPDHQVSIMGAAIISELFSEEAIIKAGGSIEGVLAIDRKGKHLNLTKLCEGLAWDFDKAQRMEERIRGLADKHKDRSK